MTEPRPETEGQDAAAQPPADAAPGVAEETAAAALDATAALAAEVADLKDRLLRAVAETENVRRRADREREDVSKYAVSKFAKDLLSVADNLRRALDAAPPEVDEALKPFIAGIEVTERELQSVFERHQIKPIEALGQRFDANLHQALFEVEDPAKPAGTVVQVVAAGYTIAGRLLRAAMVGVSKGGPKAAGEQPRVDTTA